MIIEIKRGEDQLMHVCIDLGDLDDSTLTRVYKDPKAYKEIAVNDCRYSVPNLENKNDTIALFCKYDGDEFAFQMYCADYIVADEDCCKNIGFYEDSKFELSHIGDKVIIYEKGTEKRFPILNRILSSTDMPKAKKKNKGKKE